MKINKIYHEKNATIAQILLIKYSYIYNFLKRVYFINIAKAKLEDIPFTINTYLFIMVIEVRE